MSKFKIIVNGREYAVNAASDTPLVWVIRDHIGLKGTKFGCGAGLCGACTVQLNGNAVRSCQLPLSSIRSNAAITTIEGIGPKVLHPIQEAWIDLQVPQCGYCQSGQIMTAVALLEKNPRPSDQQIDTAMAGNICRCGTYDRIRKAIHKVSQSKSAGL